MKIYCLYLERFIMKKKKLEQNKNKNKNIKAYIPQNSLKHEATDTHWVWQQHIEKINWM